MSHRSFFFIALLLGMLAACAPASPVRSTPTLSTTLAVDTTPILPTPSQQSSPIPTVAVTPTVITPPRKTLYQIEIEFNYALRRAFITQSIEYANHTPTALDELLVLVEPANYSGVFELKSLTWQDAAVIADAQWDDAALRIPLPEPLQPAGIIAIVLTYELTLPRMIENELIRPPIFGYTDRQINLVDWYPFIPPHTDTGWVVHPRGHYGEHLTYDIADYDIRLKISHAPVTLGIAASGPQKESGEWLHYRLPAARNFVFSFSPDYQVLEGTTGDITVYSYGFPLHGIANAAVLQTTIDSIYLYQELFGPYPHSTMSVVEADFLDGMEYDGLYYLSRGFYNLYSDSPSDYLIAIAAHETAHQWWYAIVGNNQATEPWLDEALCTYMEHIYYERYAPEALDWWWAYR
jgi:hypothetical protein